MRRKRSDRNHVIYKITNLVNGKCYIGLTACIGQAKLKPIRVRWGNHVSQALHGSTFVFHQEIAQFGPENFKLEVYCVIRGKAKAHRVERDVINDLQPKLNMQ